MQSSVETGTFMSFQSSKISKSGTCEGPKSSPDACRQLAKKFALFETVFQHIYYITREFCSQLGSYKL